MAKGKTLAFTLREVGAIEGSGERKDESDSSLYGDKEPVGDESRSQIREAMSALVPGMMMGLNQVVRRVLGAISLVDGTGDAEESQRCPFGLISWWGKLRLWGQGDLGKGEAERNKWPRLGREPLGHH